MTRGNGFLGDMDETPEFPRDPLHLDEGTADRLLDGLPVDDAPPSYRGVAELLSTVRAVPTSFEGEPEPWTARFGGPSRANVVQPVPQEEARQTKPTRRLRV